MAVAFIDRCGAVDFGDLAALNKRGVIGAKAHGATFVVADFAADFGVALHPFFEVVNHWLKAFVACFVVKFFGTG